MTERDWREGLNRRQRALGYLGVGDDLPSRPTTPRDVIVGIVCGLVGPLLFERFGARFLLAGAVLVAISLAIRAVRSRR